MKVPVYRFVCDNGHGFEAPHLAGEYGHFLMRSVKTSQPAVLNALEDPVYQEIDELLEELGAYKGHSSLERAEILQRIFGATCDLSPDGSEYRIGEPPRCPHCGTKEMSSWDLSEDSRGSLVDVEHVTHATWRKGSQEGKLRFLSALTSTKGQNAPRR